MRTSLLRFVAATLLCGCAFSAHAEVPKVVVSIKPIHSIVASIMDGVGEPALIVDGSASPHTYAMKPSNAAAVEQAGIVFWMGHGMEHFLEKPLESLGTDATIVALEEAPGIEKLAAREGGPFEPHEDGDEHEAEADHAHADEAAHEHGEFDMHAWLDPTNAKAMAAEISKTLSNADPDHAAAYSANLASFEAKLDAMDKAIVATLAPVKDRPFIVFHDAYQYFEHHYGVRVAGSITVNPESMPGAKRLSDIQAKIKTLGATCVFAEPQFEPKLIRVVTEGTEAKSGTLDPEAGTLQAGPSLYFQMMQDIADSLRTCLAAEG